MCLCCYHFTVSDLGLSLPSVCCKETGSHHVALPSLVYSFICTVPRHIMSLFFSFFLFLVYPLYTSPCVFIGVSSAHSSWKWEGRFRRQGQPEGLRQHFSPCLWSVFLGEVNYVHPSSVSSTHRFFLLDAKKSGGSLHPHLCGTLQVSASGEERLGTTVSKRLVCMITHTHTQKHTHTYLYTVYIHGVLSLATFIISRGDAGKPTSTRTRLFWVQVTNCGETPPMNYFVFPPGQETEFKCLMIPTRTGGRWALAKLLFLYSRKQLVRQSNLHNIMSVTWACEKYLRQKLHTKLDNYTSHAVVDLRVLFMQPFSYTKYY